MAAVLACGPDAVLSHRAALALWDLRTSDEWLDRGNRAGAAAGGLRRLVRCTSEVLADNDAPRSTGFR